MHRKSHHYTLAAYSCTRGNKHSKPYNLLVSYCWMPDMRIRSGRLKTSLMEYASCPYTSIVNMQATFTQYEVTAEQFCRGKCYVVYIVMHVQSSVYVMSTISLTDKFDACLWPLIVGMGSSFSSFCIFLLQHQVLHDYVME